MYRQVIKCVFNIQMDRRMSCDEYRKKSVLRMMIKVFRLATTGDKENIWKRLFFQYKHWANLYFTFAGLGY